MNGPINMREPKEGYEGLLKAVFELAHEDEWKLQRARLIVATGDSGKKLLTESWKR